MIRAIDRKVLRDLYSIKGMAFAVCLVIGAGVAVFVTSLSTMHSLQLSQSTYYEDFRFAHVFAGLKRAPRSLAARIGDIPGVSTVQTRIVRDVIISPPGLSEPAVGRLISLPDSGQPRLNGLFLRRGRFPEPERGREVLASEAFVKAHSLRLGDRIEALINGRRRELEIVGVALSPEYIYSIRAGDIFPDDRRFVVFWMPESVLQPAFDMDGAFNDLALALAPNAVEEEVIDRLDRLIDPFGGVGAYGRKDQVSHWFVSNEFRELRTMGLAVPLIFLAVAAFLIHVVVSRLVGMQREQIGILKAFGYSNLQIGLHFFKLVVLISLLGGLIGIAAGARLGLGMTRLYTQFFRFPVLQYDLTWEVIAIAFSIGFLSVISGMSAPIRQAVSLPPSEAMRPPAPVVYRRSVVERIGLQRLFSQTSRMIVRHLERQAFKSAFSSLGIALAVAILIVGMAPMDAVDYVMGIQFSVIQREDLGVAFVEAKTGRILGEISRLPGVLQGEPFRAVAVRMSQGHKSRRVALMGLPAGGELHRLVERNLQPVELPADGLILSSKLAEILGTSPGERVMVEFLEGKRPIRLVAVAGVVDEFMGTNAYLELGALNRLMGEGRTISGAFLSVDRLREEQVYRRLKDSPAVASVSLVRASVKSFEETLRQTFWMMTLFNVLFAAVIAVGVVYNSARISLSERSRELASLRVMGFTRAEISKVLLGEMAVLTAAAIPAGWLIGYGLTALMTLGFDTELFRIPLRIDASTFVFASLVIVAAALASAFLVRRRIDHLDLIAVLKTRE